MKIKRIGISKIASRIDKPDDWGTLTKTQHEVLREFLNRFIDICPDADNRIDPADKKRIAKVKKILNIV